MTIAYGITLFDLLQVVHFPEWRTDRITKLRLHDLSPVRLEIEEYFRVRLAGVRGKELSLDQHESEVFQDPANHCQ